MNAARRTAARGLSIVGHPAVLTPAAGLAALNARGADRATVALSLLVVAGLAAIVMVFSWRQVTSGRWGHVDAVERSERRGLNRLTLGLLLIATAGAALSGGVRLAIGLAGAALIISAASLASRWLKLSQHVAFAGLAAVLAGYVRPWAVVGGAALTAAVAWSRLELGRHTLREVVAGAGVGFAAGYVMWLAQARLG